VLQRGQQEVMILLLNGVGQSQQSLLVMLMLILKVLVILVATLQKAA
jgi:hypothetical protein